jgi:hypothetical protein
MADFWTLGRGGGGGEEADASEKGRVVDPNDISGSVRYLLWRLGSCPDWAHAPHAPRTPSHPPTSTTHISTTIEAIDKAIEDLKLHGLLVKG